MSPTKRVYILTNFYAYLKSYSPIIVVQYQLEMLQRAGYNPVLITNKGWNPPEGSIFMNLENRQLSPVVIDGEVIDEAFDKDVDMLYEELDNIIEDDSIVITHDLIFLPDYVKHNVAARRLAAKKPGIRWLHWVHSATNPQDLIRERAMFAGKYAEHLGEKFPNSVVCFPNGYDRPRVARNFNFEEDEVFEVPHPEDPTEFMAPIVQRLFEDKKLGQVEVLEIYPVRLDRGKCVEACIWFMAGCMANNMSSHLIVCDFQSTGGDKVTYREELKELAKGLGIEDRVTFLSEFDESAAMEVPKSTIFDLFNLSNVFLLPSKSETYSLIAQHAMYRRNLCILNQDFPPFRQIFRDGAIYRQFFGANISISGQNGEIKTEHSDNLAYFSDMAKMVKYYLINNPIMYGNNRVRRERNYDYIFKTYLEPLFYVGERHVVETAEVLDSPPGVFGAGANPVRRFRSEALSGQDSPESD